MIGKITALFGRNDAGGNPLGTDLHSHLIPGMDDGAKTMQESLELIRRLHGLGYRRLVTTPHIMSHRYPNSRTGILSGLQKLRRHVEAAGIEIAIDAAAEYYLDEHFMELVARKELLTFGENEVLFEMSYLIAPPQLDTIVFELQAAGYVPVLAHPERYLFLHERFDRYAELKERGVRFQVNVNSLGGYYSRAVQKAAKRIMSEGWIDYLGSDTHHVRHLDALERTFRSGIVMKALRNNTIRNVGLRGAD